MVSFFYRNRFLGGLLLLFVLTDALVATWDPVGKYAIFSKNDVQKTTFHHQDEEWTRVFFGNSSVNAAFNDQTSTSGFINYGISYGRMTDLSLLLRKGGLPEVEQLAIGLNLYAFMDEFPTDPSYPWYRSKLTPYIYFNRDAISGAVRQYTVPFLKGQPLGINRDQLYRKQEYYGTLPSAALEEKQIEFDVKYGERTLSHFQKNLRALEKVIQIAKTRDIALKIIWMPWNPTYPAPSYTEPLKKEVLKLLSEHQLQLTDWTHQFTADNFHDLGHLNVEHGRPLFTKEIESWLNEF